MWCKDPPWFNTNIKSLIREKIKTYKVHRKNIENNQQIEKLKCLQNRLKWMVDDSKHSYHSKFVNKFLNVQRNSKPYWSILKTFSNNKKVPIIPLYFIKMNSSLILKRKLNYLIHFFAKQCSLISNDSKIPSRLHYIAEKFLSTIKFSSNNIFDIIQKLDPNKKHPWYDEHSDVDNLWKTYLQTVGSNFQWMYIELLFRIGMKKGERSAYSREKGQTMFIKLPSCFVTTNIWQNPRMFDVLWNVSVFYSKWPKFRKISLVLNLEIVELINFCLLRMRYTNPSMMGLTLELSS